MKKCKILFVIVLILKFLSGCMISQDNGSRIDRVENGLHPYSWVLLGNEERYNILDRMKFYEVPGLSVAVIENGKLAWAKSYGVKDIESKEPITENTLFQAASISKSLNAMAIMQKVEKGIFSLNEDVNNYLKSWKVPENQFTFKEKVTIARLLSHTGGISNFNDRSGYLGYKITDSIPTVLQLLKGEPPTRTSTVSVEIEPGKTFQYSNGGSTILQLLLMELENKPYNQILKEIVLDPLFMTNSVFMQPLTDDMKKLAASAHDKWIPLEGKCMVYPELAAAGLWTTPTDLAKFMIEFWLSLKGKSNKIISKESAEKMISRILPDNDYTLGFKITQKGDEVYFGHRGGNYGFYSDMIMNLKSGNGAILMVNGGGDAVNSNLRREVLNSIAEEYGWKNYLPPVVKLISNKGEEVKRFIGRYFVSDDNVVNLSLKNDQFSISSPDLGVLKIFPVSDNEMVVKSVLPSSIKLVVNEDIKNDTLIITNGSSQTKGARISNNYLSPFEYLEIGNIDKAILMYKTIREKNSSSGAVQQRRINKLGYFFLNQDNIDAAIGLFKLNVEWNPLSANTYDSLAEAYMKNGQIDLAIINYEKALELNPGSNNAREMLKQLKREIK